MTLSESISTCFHKYGEFRGRAGPSEYWWFVAFLGVFPLILVISPQELWQILIVLFSLALLLPYLAVTTRRLHDIGRSGWWHLLAIVLIVITLTICSMYQSWLLLPIIPFILIPFLTWLCAAGDTKANQYGSAND